MVLDYLFTYEYPYFITLDDRFVTGKRGMESKVKVKMGFTVKAK